MPSLPDIPDGVKLRGRDFTRISEAHNSDRIVSIQGGTSFPGRNGTVIVIPRTKRNISFPTPRTFLVSGDGTANLTVSAGAINNVAYAGGTITAPANGDKVYIDATISGVTVTAVTVSAAASVPAASSTHVYKLLATVAVDSSIARPAPLGWNFSEMQICAGAAIWGGFGA